MIINIIKNLIASAFLLVYLSTTLYALPASTSAKYALIIDYDTGSILFEKDADKKVFPASMSKLMTLYILFEAISAGTVKLDETFFVSKKAWKKGGSKMFLEPESQVKVEELLKGIIVQSGNDACIVVAEALSGNEESFAELMNLKATQLGLKNSNFTNSTGWPDKDHYMTPYDLAILSKKIISDFPEFFHLFKEKKYNYNSIEQNNRNPLLFSYNISDGLKTGYTEESGFSLAATAKKDSKRLILILSGMNSARERKKEAIKLFEWAFREHTNISLFSNQDVVIESDVWLGKNAVVELFSKENIIFTVRKRDLKKYEAKVIYSSPIPAPIIKGQQYAKLKITNTIGGEIEYPLFAKEGIEKAGVFKKITSALSFLIFGGYAENKY